MNKAPTYLVLSNGRKNWSVQLDSHIIFIAKDIYKIEETYNEIIAEKNRNIKHLKTLIAKLKRTIDGLKGDSESEYESGTDDSRDDYSLSD